MTDLNFQKLTKTWVVAEIGVNHEGDIEKALEMIRLAAAVGVDAVKFQTYKADRYVSSVQPERLERVKRFELSYDDFQRLAQYAESNGVVFFSTPFHPDDCVFLAGIAPVIKISSGDLTYTELLKTAGRTGKPVILSTGMGSEIEIDEAVSVMESVHKDIRSSGKLLLMHCVAAYPTSDHEVNLRNMEWLRERYHVPVGFSDHTIGSKVCELAVAAGAVAIEKHFTYRRENQEFHDHHISADPMLMGEIVTSVRTVDRVLGIRDRSLQPGEVAGLKHLRRSIAVTKNLPKGSKLRDADLTYLRPAWGFLPGEEGKVVGKILKRDLAEGEIVTPDSVA